jgi:hypothetical protein
VGWGRQSTLNNPFRRFGQKKNFADADADGDGEVSKEEYFQWYRKDFDREPSDEEWKQFHVADKDGDGSVSRDEASADGDPSKGRRRELISSILAKSFPQADLDAAASQTEQPQIFMCIEIIESAVKAVASMARIVNLKKATSVSSGADVLSKACSARWTDPDDIPPKYWMFLDSAGIKKLMNAFDLKLESRAAYIDAFGAMMLRETEEHRKKEIISLDSFEIWFRRRLQDRRREAKEKAHEFFIEMDRDGSGSLDKNEVARVGRYVEHGIS